MTEKVLKIGQRVLAVVLLIAAAKVSIDFIKMLALEAQGPIHGDVGSAIFMARALLNGLNPYVDLFGARPPGIYLLLGSSLLLTSGNILATWVQVLLFFATPLLCALFAFWASDANVRSIRTWILVVTGFTASALFMLYTEERAGGLAPEGIGFFFSALYALLILKTGLRSRWNIAAASLTLLLSIGMKEPFIIVNLAIALLLTKSPKQLLRTFVLPLAIAAAIGVFGLLTLGLLNSYLTVHLKNMLVYRVTVDEFNPMWLRGLNTARIYANMVSYYPTGKFTGWLIIFLWMTAPMLLIRKHIRWLPTMSAGAVMLCAMNLLNTLYFTIFVRANHPGAQIEFGSSLYVWIVVLIAGLITLWCTKRKLLLYVLAALCVMYLTVLAVGAGAAYHPSFFVFAIPVYIALLFFWICAAASKEPNYLVIVPVIVLTIVAGFFYRTDPKQVDNSIMTTGQNYSARKENPAHLDRLLDACDLDRYTFAVGNSGFEWSKHTPWGPFISLNPPRYFPDDHPFVARTRDGAKQSQILIFDEEEKPRLFQHLTEEDLENFTDEPPACAKPHLPFNDYVVMFRKDL